jgi:AraC-like DNA-binding protein
MSCKYYVPAPPLNRFINHFYAPVGSALYPREKIMPTSLIDLKINFGDFFEVFVEDQTQPAATCSESWCVGLFSTYHIVERPMEKRFIGVNFKPGGAYPFLRTPLSELQNQVVSLDTIWGEFATEVRERLYEAPTLQARFALFEQMMLARLRELPYGLNAVQYGVQEIMRCDGALSIRALSDRIGMSHKHLINQFKHMVGGTPKELARLYRFEQILYHLDVAQPVDWTHVAHRYSYFDQSHFNKDFETFTGHCPSDYLRLRRKVYNDNPEYAQYSRLLPTG